MNLVKCRAQLSPDCYDGRDASVIYESGDQREDGTYRPSLTSGEGTVVCDACYMTLGGPPNEMLEEAIAAEKLRRGL